MDGIEFGIVGITYLKLKGINIMQLKDTKKEMIETIFRAKGIWSEGRNIPDFWMKMSKDELFNAYWIALEKLKDKKP